MCGIVYIKRKNGHNIVPAMVLNAYQAQKTRGTQGFGFIAVKNDNTFDYVRCETEKTAIDEILKLNPSNVKEIMFHHRMPTSTDNVAGASHPIMVTSPSLENDYYVVHNGIISNSTALRKQHEEEGFVYNTVIWSLDRVEHAKRVLQTYIKRKLGKIITEGSETETYTEKFNDSESLAIELAKCVENKDYLIKAIGSYAFIMYQVDRKTNKVIGIFCGQNGGRALKIESTDTHRRISSENSNTDSADVPTNTLLYSDYNSDESIMENKGEFYPKPVMTYSKPSPYQRTGWSGGSRTLIDDHTCDMCGSHDFTTYNAKEGTRLCHECHSASKIMTAHHNRLGFDTSGNRVQLPLGLPAVVETKADKQNRLLDEYMELLKIKEEAIELYEIADGYYREIRTSSHIATVLDARNERAGAWKAVKVSKKKLKTKTTELKINGFVVPDPL